MHTCKVWQVAYDQSLWHCVWLCASHRQQWSQLCSGCSMVLPAGSVDCIQLRTCHVGLHPAEDLSCWQHTVGITAASERCLTVFHTPASTKLVA